MAGILLRGGILCAVALLYLGTPILSRVVTHLIVVRIGPCTSKQNFVIAVSEFQMFRLNNSYNFTLNGKIDVKADIDNGWTLKVKVDKCLDIRNEDTCDFFRSIDIVKDGCISELALPIQEIFDNAQPRMSCPIKAGQYKIAKFPYASRDHFRASKTTKASGFFGYNVNAEAYNDKGTSKLACVNVLLRLVYFRDHNWGASQSIWQYNEVREAGRGDATPVLLDRDLDKDEDDDE